MNKVFILGIDGGTLDLVRPWAEKGHLPTFKKLLDQNISGNLKSTIPPLTGPAWTSFFTGQNPGKHGCFDFMKRKNNSYQREPINIEKIHQKTIWHLLSKAGKKICSINVPVTYPPKKVNGYMITGLMTPSTKENFTYPKKLKKEILKKFPSYKISIEGTYQPGQEKEIIKELREITKTRTKVIKHMYKKENFDLFMAVYGSSDYMSHWFWRYMDKNHSLHQPRKSKIWENAILNYYKLLDKQIKEILHLIDKNTTLFIISDHGFGCYEKGVYINSWLIKKRYLKLKNRVSTKIKYSLHRNGLNLSNIFQTIQKLRLANNPLLTKLGLSHGLSKKSESTRKKILNLFNSLLLLSFKDVDWPKTKAYSIGNYGQIYLNVKGREPQGSIKKEDYKKVRNELTKDLKTIRDPKTKKTIDIEVLKKEEIYKGPFTKRGPDLFFIMNNFRYIAARYFEFGSPKLFGPPHRNLSGSHRMNGIFIAYGKEIKKGGINPSLIDIAPTILHMLNVPIPKEMDGKALTNIFKKESKFKQKPTYKKKEPFIKKINI